jgi:hypothetical protein
MRRSLGWRLRSLRNHAAWVIPSQAAIRRSLGLIVFVGIGSLILYPLTSELPMLGWDWYFFFNANNAAFNISSAASAYPPFAKTLLQMLTWLPWRTSLALLSGITLLTVATATWLPRRSYAAAALALATPPLWFLLWIGHPDGLALFGMVTGVIPLALIKPQLTIMPLLRTRRLAFWTVFVLVLSLLVWPFWPLVLGQATFTHEAAFGWLVTGWPVALVGVAMLAGAGSDPHRLMAAGFLISPYLMPYNLALLLPAIGSCRGPKRLLLWATTWLLVPGVGLGGGAKYLNLVFPIAAFLLTSSLYGYRENVKALMGGLRSCVGRIRHGCRAA